MGLMISSHNLDDAVNGSKGLRFSGPPEHIGIQASYLIAGEETREREFGALKKIKNNYPKYVISMTPLVTRTDDDGIIHLSLREFLARGF